MLAWAGPPLQQMCHFESAGSANPDRRRAAGRARMSNSSSCNALSADNGHFMREFQLIMSPETSSMQPSLPAFSDPTLRIFCCRGLVTSHGSSSATFGKPDKAADNALRMTATCVLFSRFLRSIGIGLQRRREPSVYKRSHACCTAFHNEVGMALAGSLLRCAQAASQAAVMHSDRGGSMNNAVKPRTITGD